RIELSGGQLSLIRSLTAENKIARGDLILREGEICRNIHFVIRGLLRLYRIDVKGNEHILRFAKENHWISDRGSYLSGAPSAANIEAIEESIILSWKKADFDLLLKELPAFRELMRSLSARIHIANLERLYSSISNSAEEKYILFIEKDRDICNRVPLYMVASYLGVTRETLSRIRRVSINK
ncbi:MAG: Crp/Fnr family transcriptional regulator, partial [Bacteroidota bacterium]|nr:Crp/Fnr family transcriptional regulator [Bacteroidota bacterium]